MGGNDSKNYLNVKIQDFSFLSSSTCSPNPARPCQFLRHLGFAKSADFEIRPGLRPRHTRLLIAGCHQHGFLQQKWLSKPCSYAEIMCNLAGPKVADVKRWNLQPSSNCFGKPYMPSGLHRDMCWLLYISFVITDAYHLCLATALQYVSILFTVIMTFKND